MRESTAWVLGIGVFFFTILFIATASMVKDTKITIARTNAVKEAIIATHDPIGSACAIVPMSSETCRDYLDKRK